MSFMPLSPLEKRAEKIFIFYLICQCFTPRLSDLQAACYIIRSKVILGYAINLYK